MDQASEAKFLASRKDFLTLDSTALANRNQEIKFGNGRGNERLASLMFVFRSALSHSLTFLPSVLFFFVPSDCHITTHVCTRFRLSIVLQPIPTQAQLL